jgi:hypothetical protein
METLDSIWKMRSGREGRKREGIRNGNMEDKEKEKQKMHK